jgi:hypothetical protein
MPPWINGSAALPQHTCSRNLLGRDVAPGVIRRCRRRPRGHAGAIAACRPRHLSSRSNTDPDQPAAAGYLWAWGGSARHSLVNPLARLSGWWPRCGSCLASDAQKRRSIKIITSTHYHPLQRRRHQVFTAAHAVTACGDRRISTRCDRVKAISATADTAPYRRCTARNGGPIVRTTYRGEPP